MRFMWLGINTGGHSHLEKHRAGPGQMLLSE